MLLLFVYYHLRIHDFLLLNIRNWLLFLLHFYKCLVPRNFDRYCLLLNSSPLSLSTANKELSSLNLSLFIISRHSSYSIFLSSIFPSIFFNVL